MSIHRISAALFRSSYYTLRRVKLVTSRASVIKTTMTRGQTRGYESVSIFVSFSYVTREDERKELEKRRRSYRRSEESTEDVEFDELNLSVYMQYQLC